MSIKISDMPHFDKPGSRIEVEGPRALSNAELLALVIGGDNGLILAYLLLNEFGTVGNIVRASVWELTSIAGIGDVTAHRLLAIGECGRRVLHEGQPERARITSPGDAANLLTPDMQHLEREHLVVVLLDTRNQVMATETVYKGSLNSAAVRVTELFQEAVKANAAAIILAHNHPSGDPSPSREDVQVTKAIVKAGKLLDIPVLDHLIIGRNRFVSMKEKHLGFE